MSNFQKIIILLIVLLIAGWFYWFQHRPSQIKQECIRYAEQEYEETFSKYDEDYDKTGNHLNDGQIPRSSIEYLKGNKDDNYQSCLHIKGL
jgi:predicted negative regulator of RcsB-dependent stress response